MTEDDWNVGYARSIAVFLNGDAIPTKGPRGERIVDDSFFLVFNASDGDLAVVLPEIAGAGDAWALVLDTAPDDPASAIPREPTTTVDPGVTVTVSSRSVQAFRLGLPGDERVQPFAPGRR